MGPLSLLFEQVRVQGYSQGGFNHGPTPYPLWQKSGTPSPKPLNYQPTWLGQHKRGLCRWERLLITALLEWLNQCVLEKHMTNFSSEANTLFFNGIQCFWMSSNYFLLENLRGKTLNFSLVYICPCYCMITKEVNELLRCNENNFLLITKNYNVSYFIFLKTWGINSACRK